MLKYRLNDWITVSWFGVSVIVGLQTVRSIDFLSDAMKPGVPSLGKPGRLSGREAAQAPDFPIRPSLRKAARVGLENKVADI